MEAGKLDRLISLERAVVSTDALGGEVKDWVSAGEVWASVESISDGERWRAAEVAANVTTRFRIRWGPDVKVTDRIVYEGRIFDLVGVKELGRRDGVEITANARAE